MTSLACNDHIVYKVKPILLRMINISNRTVVRVMHVMSVVEYVILVGLLYYEKGKSKHFDVYSAADSWRFKKNLVFYQVLIDAELLLETSSGDPKNLAWMDVEKVKMSLDIVAMRQNDIVKMETGIRQLHDMLADMSTMLDLQVGIARTV